MTGNSVSLFLAKGMKRLPAFTVPLARKFNQKRHGKITQSIQGPCEQAAQATATQTSSDNSNDGPIWVLWWQGKEEAPAIVRACIQSMQTSVSDRQVVVITRENIHEYAKLPEYIYDKLENGSITFTHFSDILRFNLLHNHGGMWMDATLYVSSQMDSSEYFGPFFTCSGFADPTYFFVTGGKWTGFFIGGNSQEPLFAFMDCFFQLYWKNNDSLVDYFLIDYALNYAYKNRIGSLYDWVQVRKGKDNPALFDLAPIINKPYHAQVWKKLTQHTNVFKLSWKKPKSYSKGSYGDLIIEDKREFDS